MRHGQAGIHIPVPSKDAERALTEQGKEEIAKIGKTLKSMKMEIDFIATSPLMRALETAEIVAKGLGKLKTLEQWEELKPEGNRRVFYQHLSKLKEDSTLIIVGHEPLLSSIIGDLIAGRPGGRLGLKKGGAARVTIESLSPRASGKLKWLLTPKQLVKLR